MEQQIPQQVPSATKPKNWLVESILVTVLCCLIPGIVAIVFAAQVNTKWAEGDYAGALQSSKNAKTWTIVSFGIGILFIILSFALWGTLIFAALRGEAYD